MLDRYIYHHQYVEYGDTTDMSKPISIDDETIFLLDGDCLKDEDGIREESYSQQIKRIMKKYKEIR